MYHLKLLGLLVLVLMKIQVLAQIDYRSSTQEISVLIKNDTLLNAWAGGLNSTTIATLDCNFDNKADLIVFDRIHNNTLVFLNQSNKYIYSKSISEKLPIFSNYVLTYDYDNDGKKDLFTSSIVGITAFKNISSNSDLVFKNVADPIFTYYPPSYSNMNIGRNDIPSLSDIDNDGDMDILHFNNTSGVSVIWERNMSMEKYGKPDSLDFKQTDDCWGGFQEQTCTKYYFGFDCKHNFRLAHVGAGSVLTLDIDNDGDKEILLSKEDCENLNYLENKGNVSNAFFNKLAPSFPLAQPANPIPYPISAFEDVDFDGKNDLIVTLGQKPITSKTDLSKSIWWYKNTGTNQNPIFSFQSKNFIQNTMIDLGQNSHPALTDFDNDGDLDLFVSNSTNMQTKGASIFLFENIGTKNKPTYQLADSNYLNLSQYGYDEIGIKFSDLNNDNKTDLILSTQKDIQYLNKVYFNQSSSIYAFNTSTDMNFDLSELPSFEFYDIDKDNLKDALIGTSSGELHYYKNVGTTISPSFELINNDYGNIGSSQSNLNIVLADLNQNGIVDLVTSDDGGYLKLYPDIESQAKPFSSIVLKEGENNLQPLGNRLSISMGDLNNDQKPDILLGNDNGGVQLFLATEFPNTIEAISYNHFTFSVFPNPNNGVFSVKTTINGILEITTPLGKTVFKTQIEANKPFELTTELPEGIYFVSLDKMWTKKIILNR